MTAIGQHLCDLESGTSLSAFSLELVPSESMESNLGVYEAPKRLHLLPAGPVLTTRDGRKYTVADLEAVIENSGVTPETPMLLDVDHSSELGGPTKAYGWITQLYADADGLWGTVEYTEKGSRYVKSNEYRFTSAVVLVDSEKNIKKVKRITLTNTPAMPVQMIEAFSRNFQRVAPAPTPKETPMDEVDAGLPEITVEESTEEVANFAEERTQLTEQIDTLQAEVATFTAQLKDKDTVIETLKAELNEVKHASFASQVDQFLADNTSKVTPAERESFRALALVSEEQFSTVKTLVEGRTEKLQAAPESPKTVDTPELVATFQARGWSDERIQKALKISNQKKEG